MAQAGGLRSPLPHRLASPPFLLVLQRVAARRASLVVRAAQVSSNDFKNGMTIEMDGAPYKVVGAPAARLATMAKQCSARETTTCMRRCRTVWIPFAGHGQYSRHIRPPPVVLVAPCCPPPQSSST